MKVVIQIPCFNEAATLEQTLGALPRKLPGVDELEWLVVDDGSTDGTAEVARRLGAHHVVRHARNRGLASAFRTGLETCLELGADIIVNTDGDNQYPGAEVERLVEPILKGVAEVVIAERKVTAARWPWWRRLLLRVGSAVVHSLSGIQVRDAPSGFRAFSRDAALSLQVITRYTYTLENLIQLGQSGFAISFISVETNPPLRESRLIRSTWQYLLISAVTMLRLYALYRPLRAFTYLSLPFFLGGAGLWLRYLVLILENQGGRGAHLQSIVAGGAFLIVAALILCLGILGDIMAGHRRLIEELLRAQRLSWTRQRRP